jgi:hypothetical protein
MGELGRSPNDKFAGLTNAASRGKHTAVQRFFKICRLVLLVVVPLVTGWFGFAGSFSDRGPGETQFERSAETLGAQALGGMIVGLVLPTHWYLSVISAWGSALWIPILLPSVLSGPALVDDNPIVVVAASSHIYHRKDCERLQGLRVSEFRLSDLDSSFRPCEHCRPPHRSSQALHRDEEMIMPLWVPFAAPPLALALGYVAALIRRRSFGQDLDYAEAIDPYSVAIATSILLLLITGTIGFFSVILGAMGAPVARTVVLIAHVVGCASVGLVLPRRWYLSGFGVWGLLLAAFSRHETFPVGVLVVITLVALACGYAGAWVRRTVSRRR